MMSITTKGTSAALLALTLAACGGDDGGGALDASVDATDAMPAIDAPDSLVTVATVDETVNRALDLLLVVDNSGSLAEEQASLAANLPALVNVLNTAPGGLPDLHVGVVSTNVGTGGVQIGGCSTATRPEGDDGVLLTNGCPGLQATYLSDVRNPDGSRTRNYQGDLSSTLGCMVRLGTTGCGFEQPLEAMRRALTAGHNPGFLRPDALLGVVIMTDEDDCSATLGGGLFGDPNATSTSVLGPRTSFRCFEWGVQCAGDPNPRAFGARTGCAPRVGSPYLPTVDGYVGFLRGLKANPRDVAVATIAGDVDATHGAVVGPDPDDPTRAALQPSCQSAAGDAAPAIRLRAFLDGFPDRAVSTTVCNDNLADALTEIGRGLRRAQGSPCIDRTLADTDPAAPGVQLHCEVTQCEEHGGVRTNPTTIPSCDAAAAPCWRLGSDPLQCPSTPGNQRLQIDRPGPAPADVVVEARCEVEPW